jgi:adenylate kinase
VQAEEFKKIAEKIGKPVESVIALEVDFDQLVDRITGRRICPKCGAIYHVRNKPSRTEGICDECGSELQQRRDDTVEQLKVRMEEYDAKTKPIVDYFEPKGVVNRIDASKDANATFAQVKEALGKVA